METEHAASFDVVTLLLAFATVWLAVETRRMARATKEMVSLAAEPYLSFASLDLERATLLGVNGHPDRTGYVIPIKLRNPGQVRITYDVTNADVTLNGIAYPPTAFDNHNGVIHPGEETLFRYPFFECQDLPKVGLSGTLECEIGYWSLPSARNSLHFKLRFNIASIDQHHRTVHWTYMSGPTYRP